ncbi:hypothetical protein HDE_02244 [Halotydeus destructor]|nr:hypothetical protein HDE_02244 [Halotydeus destructor]
MADSEDPVQDHCAALAKYLKMIMFIDAAEPTSWKRTALYRVTILSIVSMVVIRNVLMFFTDDPSELNRLGDFCRLFGDSRPSHHVCYSACISLSTMGWMLPPFSWALQSSRAGRKVLSDVMEPLRIISRSQMAPAHLSHADVEQLANRARLLSDIVLYFPSLIVLMFTPFTAYAFYVDFDLAKEWPYAVFNVICIALWMAHIVGTLAVSMAYFSITCKLVTLRAKNLQNSLKKATSDGKSSNTVIRLLRDHDSFVTTLYRYNAYWSTYMGMVFLTFVPLITTLSYIGFFMDTTVKIMRITLIIADCEYSIIFTIICLMASQVYTSVRIITLMPFLLNSTEY